MAVAAARVRSSLASGFRDCRWPAPCREVCLATVKGRLAAPKVSRHHERNQLAERRYRHRRCHSRTDRRRRGRGARRPRRRGPPPPAGGGARVLVHRGDGSREAVRGPAALRGGDVIPPPGSGFRALRNAFQALLEDRLALLPAYPFTT